MRGAESEIENRNISWVVRGQSTSSGAGVRLLRVIGPSALPQLDPGAVRAGTLAVLGDRVRLPKGADSAAVLLVAGRPLNESVARHGPFVINRPGAIAAAIRDDQAVRL